MDHDPDPADPETVRRRWADRDGAYSPTYYAHHGPDARSERVLSFLDRFAGPDPRVLELGCSSGRHLAHLLANGYDRLAGVDVNPTAFDVMAEAFPALAERGEFRVDTVERVVDRLGTDAFDVVYSVESLQHVHPDVDAPAAIARVAADLVVTVENEGGPNGERAGADADADGGPGAGADGDADAAPEPDPGPDAEPDADRDAARGADRGRDAPVGVNVVDGELPLYYRDWGAVLAGVGCTQVAVERGTRTIARAFRP